ncbi:hypothetical protein COSO111634_31660 [Corallococcus soli]
MKLPCRPVATEWKATSPKRICGPVKREVSVVSPSTACSTSSVSTPVPPWSAKMTFTGNASPVASGTQSSPSKLARSREPPERRSSAYSPASEHDSNNAGTRSQATRGEERIRWIVDPSPPV